MDGGGLQYQPPDARNRERSTYRCTRHHRTRLEKQTKDQAKERATDGTTRNSEDDDEKLRPEKTGKVTRERGKNSIETIPNHP